MYRRLRAVLTLCLVAAPLEASAISFTYQSQTGSVGASGDTSTLPQAQQNLPISGVGNVDLIASVADSDATSNYAAWAALETTLGADSLRIVADASARSLDANDPSGFGAGIAGASTQVTVVFDLVQAAGFRLLYDWHDGTNNGPIVLLTHLDLGFVIRFSQPMDAGGFLLSCGTLTPDQCFNDLAGFFIPSGGPVPTGRYQLSFDLNAFQPVGSCAVGCRRTGGSITLVPEPKTALLLAAGLGLLASRRRFSRPGTLRR